MTAYERHKLITTILNDWTGWSLAEKNFICRNPKAADTMRKVMNKPGLDPNKNFCWIGAVRVAMFKGNSWRDYAKQHWNDAKVRGFRSWAAQNPGTYFLQKCPHCGVVSNPMKQAFDEGKSFAQFLQANPNFVWPAWPLAAKTSNPKPRKIARRKR